ncbi:hypothetical protein FRB94_009809 [Tulasnella sp. JGI-2019a]|nr:hypothetical protein FRB94_009809 [Tulasnella sp. JGI-2019a]
MVAKGTNITVLLTLSTKTAANICLFVNLRNLTVDLLYPSGFPKLSVWDGLHELSSKLERVSIIRERAYYSSNVLNDTNSDDSSSGVSTSTISEIPSLTDQPIRAERERH